MSRFTESVVEDAALAWLEGLGYDIASGPDLAPDGLFAERNGFDSVVLEGRLRAAVERLNPALPIEAFEDAILKVQRIEGVDLVQRNRTFHLMLVNGVTVEYRAKDGAIKGAQVRLVDFDDAESNEFLAVNQFTVIENKHNRRPDVIVFVNGLPVANIELKNAVDEKADVEGAFRQVQTYKAEIPSLYTYNEAILISDGNVARLGTISADRERFMPWRTIEGKRPAPGHVAQLQVAIQGFFEKRRFLDMLRYFIVFEDEGGGKLVKKMAGYHQFHAVNVATKETVRATHASDDAVKEPGGFYAGEQVGAKEGDKRIGVVWHTQGSGKSLTMAFYAGRIIVHPEMENPTIVVITDRNDLDGQLFGVFSRCQDLLRQIPEQAESRADLRQRLKRAAGGVVFTTIQKFLADPGGDNDPVLSRRRNIVVIADEAHRSQYDFVDGLARNMRDALPKASYIAFTGTPIEKADANTRSVFGDYISVYDIQCAVNDGATVPIYYENRLAKLNLREELKPRIDPEFEEATEGEEIAEKEKLKTKWAALEAIVGAEERVNLIAKDLVEHWAKRQEAMFGKAMVVCMSRRICVELYDAIVALRPDWHTEDDAAGAIKIVMTGNATDPVEWQKHIGGKARREGIAKRFKDELNPLKIVLVRDMWLTGFDVPSLHTMYVDKPMRGHSLMQAIARVNRVFRNKPGGLVVDYLGIAPELKQALAVYTENQGEGDITLEQEDAVALMLEKYEVVCSILHGFDWSKWTTGAAADRLSLLPAAQEHVLTLIEGGSPVPPDEAKKRFLTAVTELSQAFALAVPHEHAIEIRDDVGFFQAVRSAFVKRDASERRSPDDINTAIRQIVSKAVASDEVVDIFSAAGLKNPDISILSDEFLAEVQGLKHKNVAVELLRKLLAGEIKTRSRKNLIQSRSFAELLEKAVQMYQNRAIEAAQVIEELIAIAKEIRAADKRGEDLGLNEDEVAFYDALGSNQSALEVLGDKTLRAIAQELVKTVRANTRIDWTIREDVRANLRVIVKRILRKYGYPPDLQESATDLVLEQAALLTSEQN